MSIGIEGEFKKGNYSLQQLRKLQAEMLYTLCAIEEEGMIDSKNPK